MKSYEDGRQWIKICEADDGTGHNNNWCWQLIFSVNARVTDGWSARLESYEPIHLQKQKKGRQWIPKRIWGFFVVFLFAFVLTPLPPPLFLVLQVGWSGRRTINIHKTSASKPKSVCAYASQLASVFVCLTIFAWIRWQIWLAWKDQMVIMGI